MGLSDMDISPSGQKEAINEMASVVAKKYVYGFSIWPAEKWNFPKGIFEVFECLKGRIEFIWTPEHFEKTRSELSRNGLVMHEIVRTPYFEEEIIL